MQLTLISNPDFPFTVELPIDAHTLPSSPKRTIFDIALSLPILVTKYATTLIKSLPSIIIENSLESHRIFRAILFEGNRRILDPSLIIFRVITSIATYLISIVFEANKRAYESICPKVSESDDTLRKKYAGPNIDTTHMQRTDNTLDVTHLTDTCTIDQLLTFFDAANYQADDLTDDGKTYTRAELKKNLTTLIYNIKNKVPFLGTPPAYDLQGLTKFYNHIESAIRLCIDKVQENPAQSRQLALTFARAGGFCGARYMGEAVNYHMILCSEDLAAQTTDLKEKLLNILAITRSEEARKVVSTKLGSDAHGLSKFYRDFGEVLAIPGSSDVTEQISSSRLDPKFLGYFFERYTHSAIIEAIERELNKQAFREAVIDWIENQLPDSWDNPTGHEAEIQEFISALQEKSDNLFLLKCQLADYKGKCVYNEENVASSGIFNEDHSINEEFARRFYAANIQNDPQLKKNLFLNALGINKNNIAENGLPRIVIEWMLIQHGILSCKDYVDLTDLKTQIDNPYLSQTKPLTQRIVTQLGYDANLPRLPLHMKFNSTADKVDAAFKRYIKNDESFLSERYSSQSSISTKARLFVSNILDTINKIQNHTISRAAAYIFLYLHIAFSLKSFYNAIQAILQRIPIVGGLFLITSITSLLMQLSCIRPNILFTIYDLTFRLIDKVQDILNLITLKIDAFISYLRSDHKEQIKLAALKEFRSELGLPIEG